ncbi:penicillin-insensitive murein endopeptidase [Kribbella sp. NPDC026596]|uniref:penicillin-insensitive murein endopeptidase n=1 Tax=Kribbella sp. NPDC026596 TaxID=3155122 RepID=UPI0033FEB886
MKRLVFALLALVLLVGLPAPAYAYANAFFPTQSSGNRGADVQAIQFLLQYNGQSVAADGVFGATTVSAAKAFQTAKGLGVDGIVGPQTWTALAPTIRSGDNNAAVKALQVELNAKRRLSLAVDGVFSTAVRDAVAAFQSHAGIGADGIVGPITWRNLAWHYDYPDFTANLCDQDPDGNGTAANWATSAAVAELEQGARSFASTGQGQVPYGDAGFEHGGDIPGHGSHDVGMDIDIWPIRTDNGQCTAGRITWQSATYDRAATRQLIQSIKAAAPGHVRIIFFNDPTLINEGLTTEWPAHDNHLHVRFCEKVHPNSLYTC